uniref:Uncharacterized protein n=1 Tax=Knipowitschia caucasica TaxID=637954 RepID=A0AAV2K7U9_KNICA
MTDIWRNLPAPGWTLGVTRDPRARALTQLGHRRCARRLRRKDKAADVPGDLPLPPSRPPSAHYIHRQRVEDGGTTRLPHSSTDMTNLRYEPPRKHARAAGAP